MQTVPHSRTLANRLGPGLMRVLIATAVYRYASWLYYHGPNGIGSESPLTDAEYDSLQAALGFDKPTAHTITLTADEQQAALMWAGANRK